MCMVRVGDRKWLGNLSTEAWEIQSLISNTHVQYHDRLCVGSVT